MIVYYQPEEVPALLADLEEEGHANIDFGEGIVLAEQDDSRVVLVDFDEIAVLSESTSVVFYVDSLNSENVINAAKSALEMISSDVDTENCKIAEIDDIDDTDDVLFERYEIDEREAELSIATAGYITAITGEEEVPELIDLIKEKILDFLGIDLGMKIYRPMYLEDSDTGEEFFVEYPYECMI